MNKKDLIKKVTEKTGLTVRKTDEVIDAVLESILEITKNWDLLTLKWFGRFKRKTRVISAKLPMLSNVAIAKTSSNLTFIGSNLLKIKTY